ncbi:MAG: hypothetical protein AB3X44_12790, partial [Leptothrix sp. (in: b-proteobacteria)]
MTAVFANIPSVLRPGQILTGATLTCTNSASGVAATSPSCAPSVASLIGSTGTAGVLANLNCGAAVGSLAAGSAITCTFDYQVPGVQGGADEPTTAVTFTGTTGAANDSNAANNSTSFTASLIDAVNDVDAKPGGSQNQTSNLATNDQVPTGASYSLGAGSTCLGVGPSGAPVVSSAGIASYHVPASGSCTVSYQVCAPSPNTATCDTATLTVTAQSADLSPAFAGLPSVLRPGQSVTGATLTCTNAGPGAATSPSCVPSVASLIGSTGTAGVLANLNCGAAISSLAAGSAITCTFDYQVPGTQGGADEPVTGVTFSGTTGAANDSNGGTTAGGNNSTSSTASLIDAVNDVDAKPGGSQNQTTNLVANDQIPSGAVYGLGAGSTCLGAGTGGAPLVSAAGIATYHVPASGSCTVAYQVCAPSPNAATCDTATLTVTAQSADLSPAFTGIPSVLRPGQSLTGASLTCTNAGPGAATSPSCAPTVASLIGSTGTAGVLANLNCGVAISSLAAGSAITCTFDYLVPGVQGGTDEPTTAVTFTGTTGAAND